MIQSLLGRFQGAAIQSRNCTSCQWTEGSPPHCHKKVTSIEAVPAVARVAWQGLPADGRAVGVRLLPALDTLPHVTLYPEKGITPSCTPSPPSPPSHPSPPSPQSPP